MTRWGHIASGGLFVQVILSSPAWRGYRLRQPSGSALLEWEEGHSRHAGANRNTGHAGPYWQFIRGFRLQRIQARLFRMPYGGFRGRGPCFPLASELFIFGLSIGLLDVVSRKPIDDFGLPRPPTFPPTFPPARARLCFDCFVRSSTRDATRPSALHP